MLNKDGYIRLLRHYLDDNFKFVFFRDYELFGSKQILLRHDVDFDVDYALEMAKLEHSMNVKSTYFFLTHSDAYNLLSISCRKKVFDIVNFGHHVGIHYDPVIRYEDQLEVFDQICPYDNVWPIVSIHRPRGLEGVKQPFWSTYEDRYFKDISYASDSRCTIPNKITHNGQLLIHPVWWMTKAGSMIDKLNNLVKSKGQSMKQHIADNIRSLDISELK